MREVFLPKSLQCLFLLMPMVVLHRSFFLVQWFSMFRNGMMPFAPFCAEMTVSEGEQVPCWCCLLHRVASAHVSFSQEIQDHASSVGVHETNPQPETI